jgi:hypothetical protein
MERENVKHETQELLQEDKVEYYTAEAPFNPCTASPNPFMKKLQLRLELYNSELFSDDFKLDK